MPFKPASLICPICQKPEEFNFIRDYQSKDGEFSLYECKNCGLQFWNPFKNAGPEWYEKEYGYQSSDILISKAFRGCHKKFLKEFNNLPLGTKVLDIGCGVGEFIAELQKRGCQVWGVDFNKNHTEIARNKFGLKNIYTMDFYDFLKKEDLPQFDIITFFGLLEHIDNPFELVQEVKKIIKPNGIIATSAPSKENLVVYMNSIDFPPHHLSQWNREAISKLFQKIGFSISHIEYIDQFQSFKSASSEKFRLGLVEKTAKAFGPAGAKKQSAAVLVKIVHLLGEIRDYLIGGIPAIFLLGISWLMKRKGATMFVILKES